MQKVDFHPVILGGDIGVYAMARSLNEAYGVRPTVLASAEVGPIRASAIFDLKLLGLPSDSAKTVRAALDFASEFRKQSKIPLLLLANSDSLIEQIVAHRQELEAFYELPFIQNAQTLHTVFDKLEFFELCQRLQVNTPATVLVDLSNWGTQQWKEPKHSFTFPIIAKPARSAGYENLHFEGKKKVYSPKNEQELKDLYHLLGTNGVKNSFILQELIPGDDTQMRSVTAYVDSNANITMMSGAHVLLEEHSPTALGNPAAMITKNMPEIFESAKAILSALDYRGFANFDVKIDPRTSQAYFLELNPRIGRNNYYNTAAGINPMRFVVSDLIYGKSLQFEEVNKTVLYSVIPVSLLKRYLPTDLLGEVNKLQKARQVYHPLKYPGDMNLRRRQYIMLNAINHWRKFSRYYPKATRTGF